VVLTADSATVNVQSGETVADSRVRIQQGDQLWAGDHIRYNFLTRQMESEQFRTGKSPVFAAGEKLSGDVTNDVYRAQNAYVTTDDVADPAVKVRASSITIYPGKSVHARNGVLYVGGVPVFYFPYYSRNIGRRANNFDFVPGYRSRFGPYLLGSYRWFLDEEVDGELHLDYRVKRGVGGGPDLNLHMGRWGETSLKYYYLRDDDPTAEAHGLSIPENRQRFYLGYNATPYTNLNVKALLRYQSDPLLLHDFFEKEYRENPQPNTFVEINKLWSNFSLDTYVQPRINDFFETVERLPDIKLTSFRQQLGESPVYYESESSAGYYQRLFAEITNSLAGTNNFSAARADTYHQLTLPHTFFGWLNLAPRVGGRFTYYSEAKGPGGTNDEAYRGVFNTGMEATFKASRVWPAVTNQLLQVDGLRHIVEPSVNYVWVPSPNRRPPELPQFDYELPSLRLLPIEYPDYNSIDSIDSQNVLRFGLRNRLQTKREGKIENLVYWDLYTDWRLRPRSGQSTFADLFSDLIFRPRSWITLDSQIRFDINGTELRFASHNLTLQPCNWWTWSIGHWYVRQDLSGSPDALGPGNNLISGVMYFRLNENWALRTSHHFEAQTGELQEQNYTVYRDFRNWTAGLTCRFRQSIDDFTIAFTFSLKAAPKFGVGGDAVHPSQLLGY
jgi:lipopolysaccharide assembly outer membrane protein LptD (OstA)